LKDEIQNKSIDAFWNIPSEISVSFGRYDPKQFNKNILEDTFQNYRSIFISLEGIGAIEGAKK
jgi:hypothetical protein